MLRARQRERTQSAERRGKKLQDLECLQIFLLLAKAKAGLQHLEESRVWQVLGWSKRYVVSVLFSVNKNLHCSSEQNCVAEVRGVFLLQA